MQRIEVNWRRPDGSLGMAYEVSVGDPVSAYCPYKALEELIHKAVAKVDLADSEPEGHC